MTEKTKSTDDRLIPEVNIGLVGHVDHGKTTLTEALTGTWTDTHSEEIKRGITIRLGYADATFYKCKKCAAPKCYGSTKKCISCFEDCEPIRTVSFVDAPGHETLMATLLTGTSMMDGALLVVSAKEQCPQPQTAEHLTALKIAGIKNIIIAQNKIDLVTKEEAMENYEQVKEFAKSVLGFDVPIIPISAQHRINIDVLIKAIEENMPTPERDIKKDPVVLIARTFDTNKPGTKIDSLIGGVIGGALIHGELKVGDELEIKPGVKIKTDGSYEPIKTKVIGIEQSKKKIKSATPGGLLGISTTLDPYLTKSDMLSGNVAGIPGKMPPNMTELTMKSNVLERLVGSKENEETAPIKMGEPLMVTVRTMRTVGVVASAGDIIKIRLKTPVCADKGEKVVLSRQAGGRWRLIGWGEVQ